MKYFGVLVFILAACSSPTKPPDPDPIPEQLYNVQLSAPTNNCRAGTIDPFNFNVWPQKVDDDDYNLLGIDSTGTPATLDGDQLTFSVAVDLPTAVITIGGKWTFVASRETFDAPTTFEVVLKADGKRCTFTFPGAGTHAAKPVNLPTQPTGPPDAIRTLSDLTGVWGYIGTFTIWNAQCVVYGPPQQAWFEFTVPPFADARNAFAGVAEEDQIWFRYQIHGGFDLTNTALQYANNAAGGFTNDVAFTSAWFYKPTFDRDVRSPTGTYSWPAWVDSRDGRSTWEYSQQTSIYLSSPGAYYYVTFDLYWRDRSGVAWGWKHAVGSSTDFCVGQ
jgi:hypothetical protein